MDDPKALIDIRIDVLGVIEFLAGQVSDFCVKALVIAAAIAGADRKTIATYISVYRWSNFYKRAKP
jgi:hypothetical protein